MAMENPLWMEILLRTSLINVPFSIAMFEYQMVLKITIEIVSVPNRIGDFP